MNSENSKISNPNRLLVNLSDKKNLKKSYKYVSQSNLSKYYTWKNTNSQIKTINLKYQLAHGMKNL